MSHFTLFLVLAMALSVACKKTDDKSSPDAAFDVIDDPYGILADHIFKDTIKVCVFDDGAVMSESELASHKRSNGVALPVLLTTAQLKSDFPRALLAWVEPLRTLAGPTPLIKNVEIVEQGCTRSPVENLKLSQLTAVLTKITNDNAAAVYHPGNRAVGHIEFDRYYSGYSTILHELGHAFGLGDTYDSSGCKFGQPNSIMCGSKREFPELQSDDINGVKFVFCRFHKSRFSACEAILATSRPGPVPQIGTNGKPVIDLGLKVESFSQKYTEYQVLMPRKNGSSPSPAYGLVGPDKVITKAYLSLDPNLTTQVRAKHPEATVTSADKTLLGARIVSVVPEGIAAKSGAKIGSILTRLKSEPMEEFEIRDAATFNLLSSSIYDIAGLSFTVIEPESLGMTALYEGSWPTASLSIQNDQGKTQSR